MVGTWVSQMSQNSLNFAAQNLEAHTFKKNHLGDQKNSERNESMTRESNCVTNICTKLH